MFSDYSNEVCQINGFTKCFYKNIGPGAIQLRSTVICNGLLLTAHLVNKFALTFCDQACPWKVWFGKLTSSTGLVSVDWAMKPQPIQPNMLFYLACTYWLILQGSILAHGKCWLISSKSKLQLSSLAKSSKLEKFSKIGWNCGIVVPEVLQFLFQKQCWYFSYFSQKTGFDITCKLSMETICMKCLNLFSGENKKNI